MKRPAQNHQRILDEGFVSSSSNDIDMMLEDIKSGDSKMDGRSSGEGSIMRCDEPDPEAMDALIASELKSLSLEERAAVYEDVHGVAPPTEEETPEAIANWIERFKEILRKNRSKAEYEKAAFLNPDYVTDPKILMIFIRAEDYDIKAAVQRIINHYKHKLELFGIDKLARPITFEDLDEDDKAAAMTGFYQKLDLPDQSGRPVLITFPHLMNFKTVINQVCHWKFFVSLLLKNTRNHRLTPTALLHHVGFLFLLLLPPPPTTPGSSSLVPSHVRRSRRRGGTKERFCGRCVQYWTQR